MEPVTLPAEGLRLVPWAESHLTDLELAYDDPHVARFMVSTSPWRASGRDNFIELTARHWRVDNPRWAVVDEAGRLQGTMALTHGFPREVTITYMTAAWARGKGVAQRAIRAAVRFAFDEMDVQRVAWDAITGNHASRLAAIRCGFTIEGIARHGVNQRGTPRDCWVGGILPGELRESDDPPPDYGILRAQARFFGGDQPELETEADGLRLRPLAERDLDDVAASCADPEMQRWTTVPRNYTRDDAEEWFVQVREKWDEGDSICYVLADADDRYCGNVAMSLKAVGEAEIGYGMSPWARGRGWMTAAVKRVCELGFEQLALERIDWRAVVGNEASRRVAEKAGFTVEGTRRAIRHGFQGRVDSWVGSLLG
jgi:RimJ/RimL family protein N-acetyltransferase